MADIKVIYKNADGFDQEHSESADSIKLLSIKTATKELTNTKLSHLIDGADAADEHIHDARYFRKNEAISTTTGAADAGKPVKTDATGYLNDFVDVASLVSNVPHDDLDGVANSTAHTKFPLLDGTRDFTGVQKYASLVSISDDKAIPHKKYVDDAIYAAQLGDEFTVKSAQYRAIDSSGFSTIGYRVLIDSKLGTPTGEFAGHPDEIAELTSTGWTFKVPTIGTIIAVDSDAGGLYYYGGGMPSGWDRKAFESSTASTGLIKSGVDIQLDPSAAGAGLGFAAGVLSVNVDASSIEINADSLRVKALGIKDTMIDFGVGAGQVSAVDMPIADTLNLITATEVEGALQEISLAALGELYTAGEALNKGELVYVSSNNTISKLSDISSSAQAVGVTAAAYSSSAAARAKHSRGIVTGVLSGATAGLPVYWTGSGFSQTAPSASGTNVWQVGIAKNATDFVIMVKHIKKNA